MATASGNLKPRNATAFPNLVNIWRAGKGCDVTISCKNEETVKAHSLVLCSVSDKLDELLTLSNADKLISSPDVEVGTWKTLLEIMYTGNFVPSNESSVDTVEKAIALALSLGMDNLVHEYNSLNESEIILTHTDQPILSNEVFEVLNPVSTDTSSFVQLNNEAHVENISNTDVAAETHVIVEAVADDAIARKKVCFGCHRECDATMVKCILCCKVVRNDISHIETAHPFTPKSSNWVFTCRYYISENNSRDWMVCRKMYKRLYDETGNELVSEEIMELLDYECCLCNSSFSTLNEIVGHVKIKHDILASFCKICQSGFENSMICKDHEHFCNGGDLLSCLECGKVVGSHQALVSHEAVHKKKISEGDNFQNENKDESELEKNRGENTSLKRKRITYDVKRRKENCFKCASKCKAERVRCLYCFAIVLRNSNHMMEVHPFTPPTNAWIYTCRHIPVTEGISTDKTVVCAREFGINSEYQYRCYKCQEIFDSRVSVETHLRKEHNIMARICKICEIGFMKEYHVKDHEYFCNGGKILNCDFCSKKIGGLRAWKDHMNRLHEKDLEIEEQMKVDKDVNNDTFQENANKNEHLKMEPVDESLQDPDSVILSFINKSEQINSKPAKVKNDHDGDHDDIILTSERRSRRRKVTANWKYKDYLTDFCKSKVKDVREDSDSEDTIEAKRGVRKRRKNELPSSVKRKQKENIKSIQGGKSTVLTTSDASRSQENLILVNSLEGKMLSVVSKSKTSKVTVKIETSEGICSHCNTKCNAEHVLCLYCGNVVENDISHKDLCHPFSSESSIWIYSCQVTEKNDLEDGPIIFEKENFHKRVNTENRDPKKLYLYQFKCLKCQSDFATIEELQEHVTVKYKCKKCNLFFMKLAPLVKHVEKNHNVKCFVCMQCDSGFTDKKAAYEHEYFCSGGMVLQCQDCDIQFWSFTKLEEHIKSEHIKQEEILKKSDVTITDVTHEEIQSKEAFNDNPEILKKNTVQLNESSSGEMEEMQSEIERDSEWPLDDEDHDPDYADETDVNNEMEAEDIDEDDPASDYEPKDHAVKKRGPGRPRKNRTHFEEDKNKKGGPVTEEDFYALHKDRFKVVETSREFVHGKMCFTCGDSCSALTVKCGYCGMVLVVADKFNHMQEVHPLIPPTCIWPVNCRFFKLNIQIPEVVAKQTVELVVVKDDDENLTQYTKGQDAYVCTVCENLNTCSSVSAMEEHLLDSHNVRAVMCKQCGLWIKASCLNLISDHMHFCSGGDFKSCIDCGKLVGSWKNADIHVKRTHMTSLRKKRKCRKPMYKSYITETEGKYGYKILCADCNGTCKNAPVKCSLCHEIVIKDDIHMKLRHPYSPCKTWIVFCRYAMHACHSIGNPLVEYLGEKVPTVSQEDLLNEGEIPSKHPFHYKCNNCQMYFLQRKYLKLHVKKEHIEPVEKERQQTGLFTFSCKSCEAFLYGRSYFFQDHAHFCSLGELHRCEYCGERCCGLQKLNQHYKVKHNEIYSKRQKQRKKSLRVSNSIVELPEGTILKCIECSFTTQLVKSMKDHNRNVHKWRGLQLTQFCRFCFQVFKVRSDRERHEQSLHLDGQRALCEICGEDFEIPLQLERHDYYVHRGGREYVSLKQKQERANAIVKLCPYCTKEYSSQAKLNRHIKVVHEQSLVIKCHICGKNFCSQSSLKVHLDRHTGNRSCQCPYCPYTDFRGYMINSHVQMEHPGMEKPFKRNLVFPRKEETLLEETRQEEIIYEVADNTQEVIFQVPNQQIEVKQVEMEQSVEEAVAAGNVLLEYYVVQ